MASTTSPVCEKLTNEFMRLEKNWAGLKAIHNEWKASLREYALNPNASRSDRQDYEKAVRSGKDQDEFYTGETDRVLTLMIAHKCTLPDHVASAYTYAEPNHQETDSPSASPE